MQTNKEENSPKIIILIGSTGKGKSTLANVIIGVEDKFKESGASVSGTREIQKEEFIESNSSISYAVIDTVGIGDTKLKKEEVLDKVAEAVYLARGGINQVFFVIDDKFNPHEMANYDLLKTIIFDQEVVKHTTIVRTRFKKFKDLEECKKDIDLMIEEGGKLANIIKSCQKRVIYVDNPSLNILSVENENEDRKKSREERIMRGKETRSKSRETLLEHLKKVCPNQESPYQPSKLQELSTVIADYMEQKIKKRKELEDKRKKLGLDIKKELDTKATETNDQPFATTSKNDSKSIFQTDAENNKAEPIPRKKEKILIIKGISKFFKDGNEENNAKERIIKSITTLQEEIKELEGVKKLKEEIEEKEKLIRQEVLKHILNNYDEINKEEGGDSFIKNVFDGTGIDPNEAKNIDINELLNQWKKLEKSSEDKEGLMILSLEEIKNETEKREKELIELNKQLLNIKEIFKKWQSQGFNAQQAQEWANNLKSGFNPQTDAPFCAWLRDEEKSVATINIEELKELRRRYAQWLNQKKKNVYGGGKIKVFLGGTVNNSTWREELIPQLESAGIDYFNPVVADWNEEVQKKEIYEREEGCDLLLYVITKEMLGFYSIATATDDSTKRPEKTIFCYLEEGFEKYQVKSLKATGELVKKNGAQVFTSLEEVVRYLNSEVLKEQMEEIKGKLKSRSVLPVTKNERNKKLEVLFEDFPTNKEELKKRLDSIKKGLSKRLTDEEIDRLCQIKEGLEENLQEQQIQVEISPK